MTYIPYLGTFFFSRYPSVALARNQVLHRGNGLHFSCSPAPMYKPAAPRIVFCFASICHAITDPPVTKIRLWASFGV